MGHWFRRATYSWECGGGTPTEAACFSDYSDNNCSSSGSRVEIFPGSRLTKWRCAVDSGVITGEYLFPTTTRLPGCTDWELARLSLWGWYVADSFDLSNLQSVRLCTRSKRTIIRRTNEISTPPVPLRRVGGNADRHHPIQKAWTCNSRCIIAGPVWTTGMFGVSW